MSTSRFVLPASSRSPLVAFLGIVLLTSTSHKARATEFYTNSSGDGLWDNAANWSGNAVPDISNGAFINNGGTVTINTDVGTTFDVYNGQGGGSGHVILNEGGSITTLHGFHTGFADGTQAFGTYVQNGGSLTVTESFDLGFIDNGDSNNFTDITATIHGGSLTASTINIARGTSSIMTVLGGTVNVTGNTSVAGDSAGLRAHAGALVISGGSFSSANFTVGDASASQGSVVIGGNAHVTWGGTMILAAEANANRDGAGNLFVVGSNAQIKGEQAGFEGMIINNGSMVKFDFDASGISTIDLDDNGSALTLNSGSILTVDGSLFAGAGTFTLFTYSVLMGDSGMFSTVNFIGFSEAPTLTYGENALTITVVPEPGVFGLVVGGCAIVALARRRRQERLAA